MGPAYTLDAGPRLGSQAVWRNGAALIALGLLVAAPAAHAATGCETLGPTRIMLQPVYPNPALDMSLDLAALSERARDHDASHGEFGLPLGLTDANLVGTFEAQGEFAVFDPRTPQQQVCGVAKEIRVRFGFENVVVHIARELADDRCLYGEVYRHENRHIQVDRDVIALFTPRIEATLRAVVGRMGVVRGRTTETVWHEIRERVRIAVTTELKAFTHEMRKRQRFVDRPEEYRRLSLACGGAVGRLLAARRSE